MGAFEGVEVARGGLPLHLTLASLAVAHPSSPMEQGRHLLSELNLSPLAAVIPGTLDPRDTLLTEQLLEQLFVPL